MKSEYDYARCKDCHETYYADWPNNDILVIEFDQDNQPLWQCFVCIELEQHGFPPLTPSPRPLTERSIAA